MLPLGRAVGEPWPRGERGYVGCNGNDHPGCGGETSCLVSRMEREGKNGREKGEMDQWGKVGTKIPKRMTFLGEMTEVGSFSGGF